jgi:hypothetical protein
VLTGWAATFWLLNSEWGKTIYKKIWYGPKTYVRLNGGQRYDDERMIERMAARATADAQLLGWWFTTLVAFLDT